MLFLGFIFSFISLLIALFTKEMVIGIVYLSLGIFCYGVDDIVKAIKGRF